MRAAGGHRCDSDALELPLSALNDGWCDCADGTDEPGTPACAGAGGRFWCAAAGGALTLNRTGCLVALANVCVTARYKTAWSSASRGGAMSAAARDARGDEAAQTLRSTSARPCGELVEHTLPWAAAALIPFIIFSSRPRCGTWSRRRRDGLRAALLHRGARPRSTPSPRRHYPSDRDTLRRSSASRRCWTNRQQLRAPWRTEKAAPEYARWTRTPLRSRSTSSGLCGAADGNGRASSS